MKVPFMDLKEDLKPHYDEIISKIEILVKNTAFIGGDEVDYFEKEFADYCGTEFCVGCSNGTDALILSLKILGIGPGDTVLVPANTFIATSEAVSFVGAEVDFIDVTVSDWTMDPVKLDEYFSEYSEKNVKAVIPVHLYGKMCDMPSIMNIAKNRGFKVIEDSAQSHGAQFENRGPGQWGDIATFSFYPGKNLGAFGDAGAIVTNDKSIYEKVKAFVNHGRLSHQKYQHAFVGSNMRIDSIQAAVLRIKLRYLNSQTEKRIELANRYLKKLASQNKLKVSAELFNAVHVFHLFVIHVENRDVLKKRLNNAGIITGIHYPIPLHLQPAYLYKNYKINDFPNSEYNAANCLSLPLWPEMGKEKQDYVILKIAEILKNI